MLHWDCAKVCREGHDDLALPARGRAAHRGEAVHLLLAELAREHDRRAIPEATTGAPGPVHLDFMGLAGEGAADAAEADLEVVAEIPVRQ